MTQARQSLTVAVELAQKVQRVKAFDSNMTGIMGMQSTGQIAVQDLQKAASELVFAIRNGRSVQDKLAALKAVEGALSNVMVLGIISQEEIHPYDRLTEEIFWLIDMES